MSSLPINVEDLLRQRTVESERIEYKAGWNPVPIIRTICAFANDFHNLDGGYVVVGQESDEYGQPIFPPAGIKETQLDEIQRKLNEYCSLIQPPYLPIVSLEKVQGKNLVVIWAHGGYSRPYSAPRDVTVKQKDYRYYIRSGSSTIEPRGDVLNELFGLAQTVPFDPIGGPTGRPRRLPTLP